MKEVGLTKDKKLIKEAAPKPPKPSKIAVLYKYLNGSIHMLSTKIKKK